MSSEVNSVHLRRSHLESFWFSTVATRSNSGTNSRYTLNRQRNEFNGASFVRVRKALIAFVVSEPTSSRPD